MTDLQSLILQILTGILGYILYPKLNPERIKESVKGDNKGEKDE